MAQQLGTRPALLDATCGVGDGALGPALHMCPDSTKAPFGAFEPRCGWGRSPRRGDLLELETGTSSCDHGHADHVAEALIDDGTEDDVRIWVGNCVHNFSGGVHFK